jgi:mono/diheme cytochrome c family protein
MIARTALLILLIAAPPALAEDSERDPLTEQGRTLAETMCAQCHAIGRSGRSPHAQAPPFRELGRRLDLDFFSDRLREALTVDHPDMPAFRFTRPDARAFVFYLRSIQSP